MKGYEAGLRAAIENLVDNALKFTPSGGSVTLGAAAEDRQALIWVEDSGIGIPPEDVAALFSRFHRGRNAAAYPGSGLGLAIVEATMELHGGKASVTSSPAGSRFELQAASRLRSLAGAERGRSYGPGGDTARPRSAPGGRAARRTLQVSV